MIPVILPTVSESSDGSRSFIHEIVPITLNDTLFPDLVMLRWYGKGASPSPIQVLSHKDGQYVDTTSTTFIGPAGNTSAARNYTVADFNGDGRPGIFIADHGLDTDPFPGGQNTLLLPTPDGRLINATAHLPQVLGFSHSVSTGIVNDSGHFAVFVGNTWSKAKTAPQFLMNDGNGHFSSAQSQLPNSLSNFDPPYTASTLTDLTGSGHADLVVGTANAAHGTSKVYLNPGNGDFSQVMPIDLPSSPLPSAQILDIKPIHISGSKRPDLIVVSTNGDYTAYAVQVLINDGTGHFTDETTLRFGAPITGTGGRITRVHIADLKGDGTPDIITQSGIGPTDPPSQIFLNDGNGHFSLQETIPKTKGSVYNITSINDQMTLIVSNGQNVTLELVNYPPANRPPSPARKLHKLRL